MHRTYNRWDIPGIKPGLSKTIQRTITNADTLSFGCGADAIKELLPTPTLTALMVEGAISVIDSLMPDGYVTVAMSSSMTYLNPTFLGVTVTVLATLTEINGRKLVFECMAFDELGQIGRGKHERLIVNIDQFLLAAHKRCDPLKTIMK